MFMALILGHTVDMSPALLKVELCSSPPRMRNGFPSTISRLPVAVWRRKGACSAELRCMALKDIALNGVGSRPVAKGHTNDG